MWRQSGIRSHPGALRPLRRPRSVMTASLLPKSGPRYLSSRAKSPRKVSESLSTVVAGGRYVAPIQVPATWTSEQGIPPPFSHRPALARAPAASFFAGSTHSRAAGSDQPGDGFLSRSRQRSMSRRSRSSRRRADVSCRSISINATPTSSSSPPIIESAIELMRSITPSRVDAVDPSSAPSPTVHVATRQRRSNAREASKRAAQLPLGE